jgi:hypothetical protein
MPSPQVQDGRTGRSPSKGLPGNNVGTERGAQDQRARWAGKPRQPEAWERFVEVGSVGNGTFASSGLGPVPTIRVGAGAAADRFGLRRPNKLWRLAVSALSTHVVLGHSTGHPSIAGGRSLSSLDLENLAVSSQPVPGGWRCTASSTSNAMRYGPVGDSG